VGCPFMCFLHFEVVGVSIVRQNEHEVVQCGDSQREGLLEFLFFLAYGMRGVGEGVSGASLIFDHFQLSTQCGPKRGKGFEFGFEVLCAVEQVGLE